MTAGETSAPMSVEAAVDVFVEAQIDLATDWRFWAVMQDQDGRVFAGRVGDWRIFGRVLARIDVVLPSGTTTYGLNPETIAHWTVAAEAEVREAAAIIGLPSRADAYGPGGSE